MHRIIIILSSILAAILGGFFLVQANHPPLEIEGKVLNLGTVASDVATTSISVRNTSDKPLHISGVHSSCGCTTGTLPETIAPHSTANLKVTYRPKAVRQNVKEAIWIDIAGYRKSSIEIPVVGTVSSKSMTSESVAAFGTFSGAGQQKKLTVTLPEEYAWRILGTSSSQYLVATVGKSDHKSVEITTQLKHPLPAGEYHDEILLPVDNGPLKMLKVAASFSVGSQYRLSQPSINIGEVARNASATGEVVISGSKLVNARIKNSPTPMVSLLKPGKEFGSLRLTVSVQNTGTRAELVNTKIVIQTGNPKEPELVIPVYAALG